MAWTLSSAGLVAPATYAYSSNNNTFDEYEFGTYTPVLKTDSTTITCDIQYGDYVLVGRLLHLNATFRRSDGSVGSGNGQWHSLPFTTRPIGTQVCGSAWADSGNDQGHKGTWAIWADNTAIAWLHGSNDHDPTRYCAIYDTADDANGCANRDHLNASIQYIVKTSH